MNGFRLPDFQLLTIFAVIGFVLSAVAGAFLIYHLVMAVWLYL